MMLKSALNLTLLACVLVSTMAKPVALSNKQKLERRLVGSQPFATDPMYIKCIYSGLNNILQSGKQVQELTTGLGLKTGTPDRLDKFELQRLLQTCSAAVVTGDTPLGTLTGNQGPTDSLEQGAPLGGVSGTLEQLLTIGGQESATTPAGDSNTTGGGEAAPLAQ